MAIDFENYLQNKILYENCEKCIENRTWNPMNRMCERCPEGCKSCEYKEINSELNVECSQNGCYKQSIKSKKDIYPYNLVLNSHIWAYMYYDKSSNNKTYEEI